MSYCVGPYTDKKHWNNILSFIVLHLELECDYILNSVVRET